MTETIRKLELLLFVSREPLSMRKAAALLEVSGRALEDLVTALQEQYDDEKKGITVLRFGDRIQLATNDRYRDFLMKIIDQAEDRGLGRASLEVLSIIAYRQPITKVEIDHLRGVHSDYSIRVLMERGLIEVKGTLDTVGNPKLYATTPVFLRNFNLQSLDDLEEPE